MQVCANTVCICVFAHRFRYSRRDVELENYMYRYIAMFAGLFGSSHMQYEFERDEGPRGEPSIAEMTRTAIEILQKNDKGYFLFVEGEIN
jgi:alkaline phosphatase